MIIKSVDLETVCGVTSRLPENTLPELPLQANPMWANLPDQCPDERKSYARTSSQPGKTQTINFYHINDACITWICGIRLCQGQ